MSGKVYIFLTLLIFTTAACSQQTAQTSPSPVPTQTIEGLTPAFTSSPGNLPLTEAEVPRVTVEEAKAAFDSGEAIIVDVRWHTDFEASHIPGAINLYVDEINANPNGLNLNKDQWIITYCT